MISSFNLPFVQFSVVLFATYIAGDPSTEEAKCLSQINHIFQYSKTGKDCISYAFENLTKNLLRKKQSSSNDYNYAYQYYTEELIKYIDQVASPVKNVIEYCKENKELALKCVLYRENTEEYCKRKLYNEFDFQTHYIEQAFFKHLIIPDSNVTCNNHEYVPPAEYAHKRPDEIIYLRVQNEINFNTNPCLKRHYLNHIRENSVIKDNVPSPKQYCSTVVNTAANAQPSQVSTSNTT